jgi:hypothetical protein
MKTFWLYNLILTLFVSSIVGLFSESGNASAHPWRDEDLKPGYSEESVPEKEESGEILYAVDNPYKNEVRFSEKVFDKTLKKDITQRYQEKFGRTEAEIIQTRTPYLNSNFSEGASITFNEEDYQKQQQSFGNYIGKRLLEYHFEKEAKDSPSLRGVYDAKVALENAHASVGEFKIRARYRIASNSIITAVKNPYINLECRYEMSGDKEVVYSAAKDLGNRYSFLTDYYATKPRWDLIGRKAVTDALSLSLTYTPFKQTDVIESAQSVTIKERSTIAGLTYAF